MLVSCYCVKMPVEQLAALSWFYSLSYTPGPSLGPELSGVFLTVEPQASCPASEKGLFD